MYYPDEAPQQNSNKNNLRLTKNGVQYVFVSKTNPVRGRILPSYDFTLNPKDQGFATSFVPYRDPSRISDQGLPMFRSWFFYFPMHTYLGRNKHFFVSPEVRADFNPTATELEKYDPVKDMFWKIRRNDTEYMHLRNLVVKPKNSTEIINLPLALAKRCAVMNFFGSNDGKNPDSNFLAILSDMGMTMVKEVLDAAGLRSQAPRDENWADFLYGDVTHPITGLEARAGTKIPTGNNERGIPVNTLQFADNDKTLNGARALSVTIEALAGRHNFFDIENIWNIPSAQEIVDRLVDDGEIPLEFMKTVCGKFCDFPDREAVRYDSESTSVPSRTESSVLMPDQFRTPAQPQQQAYQAPQQQYQPQPQQLPEAPHMPRSQEPQAQQPAGGPPGVESDKEFAERIDREVEALKVTNPAANFSSILKDNMEIIRYLNGKKII